MIKQEPSKDGWFKCHYSSCSYKSRNLPWLMHHEGKHTENEMTNVARVKAPAFVCDCGLNQANSFLYNALGDPTKIKPHTVTVLGRGVKMLLAQTVFPICPVCDTEPRLEMVWWEQIVNMEEATKDAVKNGGKLSGVFPSQEKWAEWIALKKIILRKYEPQLFV